MRRVTLGRLLAACLSILALTVGLTPLSATPALAAADTVTAVGDWQTAAGCSANWQPDCAATILTASGGTYSYSTTSVPAGS